MPDVPVCDVNGDQVGEASLSDQLLAAPLNEALIHQALVDLDRARRTYSAHTKTRAQVRGTSGKWYRQKGTGRARHGDRQPPIFVGGGVAHGPRHRPAKRRMPKRMRRAAMRSVLSSKRCDGRLTVLDEFRLEDISTAEFIKVMDHLNARGRVLIVLGPEEDEDRTVYLSSRNVRGVTLRTAPHLSVRDLLGADRVVLTQASVATLQETWC